MRGMMLAVNLDMQRPQKAVPGYVSVKHDGVACKVLVDNPAGNAAAYSRDDKPLPSAQFIADALLRAVQRTPGSVLHDKAGWVCGELVLPGQPFSITSGVVRSHASAEPHGLKLIPYDLFLPFWPDCEYRNRRFWRDTLAYAVIDVDPAPVQMLRETYCDSVPALLEEIGRCSAGTEGAMIRHQNELYEPGKRRMFRYKHSDTHDLRCVGFEEGRGKNAGAVGALIGRELSDTHREFRVGAGKLAYSERRALWEEYGAAGNNKVFEAAAKPDSTYNGLREPTFQRWREDRA